MKTAQLVDGSVLNQLCEEITFPEYTFEWESIQSRNPKRAQEYRLRAWYLDEDIYTGIIEKQYTRWWYIEANTTKSSVAQTMFKLILTSAEHFAREHFKYNNRAVFSPHHSIDMLWENFDQNDIPLGGENG